MPATAASGKFITLVKSSLDELTGWTRNVLDMVDWRSPSTLVACLVVACVGLALLLFVGRRRRRSDERPQRLKKGVEAVVIVGAGQAGGTAAALLRQHAFTGSITLIGEEAITPYEHPPLSKGYLKGDVDAESLKLKTDSFYHEANITLHLGAAALGIDRAAKTVTIEGPLTIPYDALILATGSRTNSLPVDGAQLSDIYKLRTLADAEALKAAIRPGRRLLVIGGGYIGLEVAASARALGAEVVVVERESRCLARVASEPLSIFFQDYHRAQGVEIIVGAALKRFQGDANGFVRAAELEDGRVLGCDVALVGVGGSPRDELARAANLSCDSGVLVDAHARTSDPNIYAIGDVTRRPMPLYGGRLFRLESVPNAFDQARQAVAAILGSQELPTEVPWFWSDQYDLRLQIAGVPLDADQLLVRGDPSQARFAVFHLKDGRIRAVEAVNAAPEYMAGKQLIASGKTVDLVKLSDLGVSMKAVAD
jgi:3-phenylpropionate/trans-cinnamate dioxygenase ferredoxin reductase subunit